MNIFDNVAEFMKAMGQEHRQIPMADDGSDSTAVDESLADLYCDLITEEYQELLDTKSLTGEIDAICDTIWVLCGLAFSLGVRPDILQECWNEVYRSNMDKLNGPIAENGKRLKPEGWRGPEIAAILEKHRKAAE